MKKPAQLSDSLLSMRPRKGQAKPQSEHDAAIASVADPAPATPESAQQAPPRRRRRLSEKKLQLNLRVSEKSLERFTKLADDAQCTFGDLFEKMLDRYEDK